MFFCYDCVPLFFSPCYVCFFPTFLTSTLLSILSQKQLIFDITVLSFFTTLKSFSIENDEFKYFILLGMGNACADSLAKHEVGNDATYLYFTESPV